MFSHLHHLKFTVWGKHSVLRKLRALCEFCVNYIINFDNIRCKPSRKKSFKELLQIRAYQENNKVWTEEGEEWKRTAPHSGVQQRKQELHSSSWCIFTNICSNGHMFCSDFSFVSRPRSGIYVGIDQEAEELPSLASASLLSFFLHQCLQVCEVCQWSYEECVMNVYVNYNCIPAEHVGSSSSRREFAPPGVSSSCYVISAFTYSFACSAAVPKHLPPTPWISILKTCDTLAHAIVPHTNCLLAQWQHSYFPCSEYKSLPNSEKCHLPVQEGAWWSVYFWITVAGQSFFILR